jgi:hypothetical protein
MALPNFQVYELYITITEAVVLPAALETIEIAVASRVNGTATIGANVVRNRPLGRPWPKGLDAAANVRVIADELIARSTSGTAIHELRRATVQVQIVAQHTTIPAELVKSAMAEISTALLVDKDLGINAIDIWHQGTEIETEGEKRAEESSEALMEWLVEYQIDAANPDVIIP